MNQKGFVNIVLIVLVVVFVGVVGYFALRKPVSAPTTQVIPSTPNINQTPQTPASATTNNVHITQDLDCGESDNKNANKYEYNYEDDTIYKTMPDGSKDFVYLVNPEKAWGFIFIIEFSEKNDIALVEKIKDAGETVYWMDDLYTIDLITKATTSLPIFKKGADIEPCRFYFISPSGKCIAYINNQNLNIYNIVNKINKEISRNWSQEGFCSNFCAKGFNCLGYPGVGWVGYSGNSKVWSKDNKNIYYFNGIKHNEIDKNYFPQDPLFQNDKIYAINIENGKSFDYYNSENVCTTARSVVIYPRDDNFVLSRCLYSKNNFNWIKDKVVDLSTGKIIKEFDTPMYGENQLVTEEIWKKVFP